MTEAETLTILASYAGLDEASRFDGWGVSRVHIESAIGPDELRSLAATAGLVVTAYFGDNRLPIDLSDDQLDRATATELAALTPTAGTSAAVMTAASATDAALFAIDRLVAIDLRYDRPGWARTLTAFEAEVERDWLAVARSMPDTTIEVEGVTVAVATVPAITPGAPPVTRPLSGATASTDDVWQVLTRLADAAAWANIAVKVEQRDSVLLAALHSDQRAVTPIELAASQGGAGLFDWWAQGADGDREQALRYVLRLLTAASPSSLPDAKSVHDLAERQRIALARDRAAEVFRAISDGQKDTAELIEASSRTFADLVEDTTKTANAMVLGVLGVLAIIARSAGSLPAWLVVLAAFAAVSGVAAVVLSRWRRVTDQQSAHARLVLRLRGDPLLPQSDLETAEQTLAGFNVGRRARIARRHMSIIGGIAAVVALSGASWLIWVYSPPKASKPAGRTPAAATTTSSTMATTVGPVAPRRGG